jgi:hypothetical protein
VLFTTVIHASRPCLPRGRAFVLTRLNPLEKKIDSSDIPTNAEITKVTVLQSIFQ